jgi:hypothetical protein
MAIGRTRCSGALHAQDITAHGRYYPHQWLDGAAQGIIEFFDLLVG